MYTIIIFQIYICSKESTSTWRLLLVYNFFLKSQKMPTVQDEEESLCLLAADLQDLPPRDDQMIPNAANTNWTTNDDDDEDEVSPRLNYSFLVLPNCNISLYFRKKYGMNKALFCPRAMPKKLFIMCVRPMRKKLTKTVWKL